MNKLIYESFPIMVRKLLFKKENSLILANYRVKGIRFGYSKKNNGLYFYAKRAFLPGPSLSKTRKTPQQENQTSQKNNKSICYLF